MGGAAEPSGGLGNGNRPSDGGAAEVEVPVQALRQLRELSAASSSTRDPSPRPGALQLTMQKFLLHAGSNGEGFGSQQLTSGQRPQGQCQGQRSQPPGR